MVKGFIGKYAFLSNFYMHPVSYHGNTYPSSEHPYQLGKTEVLSEKLRIALAQTPGEAKTLGKSCTLRPDWEQRKFIVMAEVLACKFDDPELRRMLLETGDEYLEETNNWRDAVWGVCNGVGTNYLGIMLMQLRSALRQQRGLL